MAKERARQVGRQTADALGKMTTRMDDVSDRLSQVTAQVTEQLAQLQQAVSDSRQAVADAAGMAQTLNAEIEA